MCWYPMIPIFCLWVNIWILLKSFKAPPMIDNYRRKKSMDFRLQLAGLGNAGNAVPWAATHFLLSAVIFDLFSQESILIFLKCNVISVLLLLLLLLSSLLVFMFHCLPIFFEMFSDFPCFSLDHPATHDLLQVTQHLKWATKFHRVRGVHVTPTVFVNGLEVRELGEWNSTIKRCHKVFHQVSTCITHIDAHIHTAIPLMANLWIENGISAAVWLYDFEKFLTQLTEDTEATFLASKHRFKSAVPMDVGIWRWYTWQFSFLKRIHRIIKPSWHISNFAVRFVECEESNPTGWHRKQWLESRWMEGISCNLVERFESMEVDAICRISGMHLNFKDL